MKSRSIPTKFLLLLALLSVLPTTGRAGNYSNTSVQTWTGNWTAAPGSAGTAYVIGSGANATDATSETVRFYYATTPHPGFIDLDSTYNLALISFYQNQNSSTVAESIESTGGSLVFDGSNLNYGGWSGGVGINVDYAINSPNLAFSVNAPIYLDGMATSTLNGVGSPLSNATVFFSNNTIASQNITLNIGSATNRYNIQGLQLTSASDPVILTLYGTGGGTVNDNIIDGTGQGSLTNTAPVSLDFVSASTWALTGTNTYSGPTLATGGGTLLLDDTAVNAQKISTGALTFGGVFTIAIGGNATEAIGAGTTVELLGNASAASSQSVSSTIVSQGANTLEVGTGLGQSATFNMGAISRTAAGTINFQLVNNGGGTAAITTTTQDGSGNPGTGISNYYMLGSFATLNGTDWADVSATGAIVAATYTNDLWSGLNNTNVTKSETGNSTLTNSLRFAVSAPITLTLKNGTDQIVSGGILMSSAVGKNNVTITGGTSLNSGYDSTGGGNYELIVQQFDTQGTLYIQSSLGASTPILTLAGGGTLNISGNNSYLTTVNIDAGTLQLGSSTAIVSGSTPLNLYLDGNTSALDLNGYNASVAGLYSYNFMGGVTAQRAGLVPLVENTAAGTISNLTISGGSATDSYYGDLYEGAGAVLNVVKNGATTVNLTAGWYADSTFDTNNGTDGTLAYGPYEVLNGGLTINAGYVGIDSDLYMLGGLFLNGTGTIQAENNNSGGYGLVSATYLSGTGVINMDTSRDAVYINLGLGSSGNDIFAGTVISGHLLIDGAGVFTLSAAQTAVGFNSLDAEGATTVITSGLTASTGNADNGAFADLSAMGAATLKITGTSGVVAGVGRNGGSAQGIGLAGGTLWISPAAGSSPQAIAVTGNTAANTTLYYGQGNDVGGNVSLGGNGTLLLDRNTNTSLKFTLGNTTSATSPDLTRVGKGTLVIAATDGIANLGGSSGTESLVLLGANSTILPTITNGMVSASIIGADATVSGNSYAVGKATFLTYNGTGAVGDTGFTGVTYDDTNFTGTTTNTTKELVTSSKSIAGATVYALRDDSVLTNSGTLSIGNGSTTAPAGLILNNGSILGSGTLASGASELAIYTNGLGYINNTITTTGGLTIFGPGTLYLTQSGALSYSGQTTLNSGVLDLGSAATSVGNLSATSNLQLQGGVLEASGTFSRILGTGATQFQIFNGGFAASSSSGLVVKINNSTAGVVWASGSFMTDAGILQLGSATALGVTDFQSGIILGSSTAGTDNTSNNWNGVNDATLYREIGVTDNTASTADYGMVSAVISDQTGDYRGIEKVGNGMLYLSAVNTYTGPTAISAGTLAINSDSSLGAAPTAAYAITGTVTMGAVQIDGGATLLDFANNVQLSANRTILLGGGGASGLAVETGDTLTVNSRIGDSIGGPGSLDINPTTGLGYNAATTRGTVVFTSNYNTYSGGTTVETGTTFFANNTLSTSSATGAGGLVIMSGAKLRGTGYIAPSNDVTGTIVGVTINAGANLAPGTTSSNSVANGFLTLQPTFTNGYTTVTGALLTLASPTAANGPAQLSFSLGNGTNGITGANLVVNGVTLAGSSTYISLPVDSAGEVVFSLNPLAPTLIQLSDLTNGGLATGNYLLFAGQSDADYLFGTTTMTDGAITSGLALAPGFTGGTASLYLQDGDIYVDVVSAAPEPSTWALLVLGFVAVPIYRLRKALRS